MQRRLSSRWEDENELNKMEEDYRCPYLKNKNIDYK